MAIGSAGLRNKDRGLPGEAEEWEVVSKLSRQLRQDDIGVDLEVEGKTSHSGRDVGAR